jgi:hypothetical protein
MATNEHGSFIALLPVGLFAGPLVKAGLMLDTAKGAGGRFPVLLLLDHSLWAVLATGLPAPRHPRKLTTGDRVAHLVYHAATTSPAISWPRRVATMPLAASGTGESRTGAETAMAQPRKNGGLGVLLTGGGAIEYATESGIGAVETSATELAIAHCG